MEHFVEKLDHDRRLSLRMRNSMWESNTRRRKIVAARIFLQTDLPLSKGTALDLPVEMPEQVRR